MKSIIVPVALLFLASASPATATEWVYCSDAADEVQVGMLLGGDDFASIIRATLWVGTDKWATDPDVEPGTAMRTGEYAVDAGQLAVDLAPVDSSAILAQLRVFIADEGEDYVQGGTLRVPGRGAWVVICEGP